jgi:hypothetical protein
MTPMSAMKAGGSACKPAGVSLPLLRNTLVREHFWSNDFIRKLQLGKLRREGFGAGFCRTFEDLPVARPVSIFEEISPPAA